MSSWTVAMLAASLQAAPTWAEAPVPSELVAAEVRAVEVTEAGDVWVAARDRGLGRIRCGAHTLQHGLGCLPDQLVDVDRCVQDAKEMLTASTCFFDTGFFSMRTSSR